MYFVKYGKEYLHDPRVESYMLMDLSLDAEENSCGYCDFTIYSDHPLYYKLKERDAANPIEVYDDDILLFAGFIYELGKEFYLDGRVRCKGELDYLTESIVRPYATYDRTFGDVAPRDLHGYFEWLINSHNENVDDNRKFTVGINEADKIPMDYDLELYNDGYPTTMDEIKRIFIDKENGYGGCIRTRHENGIRYIDYIYEWTDTNSQILDFGVNLTSYSQVDDAASVYTYILPTGASMSETDCIYNDGYYETSDTVPNPEKDYYTQSYDVTELRDLTRFAANTQYWEHEYIYYVTEDESPTKGKTYYIRKDLSYFEYVPADMSEWDPINNDYYIVRTDTVPWVTLYKQVHDRDPVPGRVYYTLEKVTVFDENYTPVQTDHYTQTTDTTPSQNKTYYIAERGRFNNVEYKPVSKITRFKRDTTYYELEQKFDEGVIYYDRYDNYVESSDDEPETGKIYYIRKNSYSKQGNLEEFKDDKVYFEYNELSDESKTLLTIKNIEDGSYIIDDFVKVGDIVYSASSVERYGWIGYKYSDTDIISEELLLNAALIELTEFISPKRTIEIKAVDMHLVDPNVKPIRIGEYVRVRSDPHGFDSYLLCRSISLDLNNPENSIYTLSTSYDSRIGEESKMINELNSTINKEKERATKFTDEELASAYVAERVR